MKTDAAGHFYSLAAMLSVAISASHALAGSFDDSFKTGFATLSGNAPATAVTTDGTDIYVADFIIEGGTLLRSRIYKWTSSSGIWSRPFQANVHAYSWEDYDGKIYAMAVSGNTLYVGGSFNSASSVQQGTEVEVTDLNNIAKLDLSTGVWSSMGGGVTGGAVQGHRPQVRVIKASPNNSDRVYVGGRFVYAGGLVANNIVRWNVSAQTWRALNQGVSPATTPTVEPVMTVYVSTTYLGLYDELMVGGDFTKTISPEIAYNIANYSQVQNAWYAFGSGMCFEDNVWNPQLLLCQDTYLPGGSVRGIAQDPSLSSSYTDKDFVVGTHCSWINGQYTVLPGTDGDGCVNYQVDRDYAELTFTPTGSAPTFSLATWYARNVDAKCITIRSPGGTANRFVGTSAGFEVDNGVGFTTLSTDSPDDITSNSVGVFIVGGFGAKRWIP